MRFKTPETEHETTMFIIQLAEIRIRIENKYAFIERQCADYIVHEPDYAFSVSATEEELREEQQNGDFSAAYCESICIYRHICEILPDHNVFLMHSSVVVADGNAYAFTAKSGVGKSTHTALWLKNIPGARVLNGDKPLFRVESDGSVTAFGTPWNGKENWGENARAPLRAVCFIERGERNAIAPAEQSDAIGRLVHQLYLRGARESVNKQLVLMDALVRAVPFYVLSCTISDEAAKLAYETMK